MEYETRGCGGEFNKPNGRINSPNYPNAYPHNMECEWIITAEVDHLVELTFTDFDFEATSSCAADGIVVWHWPFMCTKVHENKCHVLFIYFQIANSPNKTNVIEKLCSSKHQTAHVMTSTGNKMYISFFSDFSYAGKGFAAMYRTIPASQCRQLIHSKQTIRKCWVVTYFVSI